MASWNIKILHPRGEVLCGDAFNIHGASDLNEVLGLNNVKSIVHIQ